MKKIFFIFLFCLFFIPKKIYALQFTKYQNNPLSINFINDYSYILQVDVFQKNNNGCSAIAAARRSVENYYSLIKIDSNDCINWFMTKEVLNISQDITNPRVFINDNNQITIFFAKQDSFDFYRIYKTSCDNQFNCSSDIKLILDPNKNISQEKNGYFAPEILKYQNQYYMFYGVWGNDGFKIRLAYSNDLENWQKCSNNLLTDGSDGPFLLINENFLYLFYHKSDSSGIKLAKANLPISCNLSFQDEGYILQKGNLYDAKHLIFPSVLFENNNFKIFYSGLSIYNGWSLNLACTDSNCDFNFPTSTPTPIPTKIPLIILPGFMGSWNREAILHNQEVDYGQWKLAPFVKEYDGIINTLKNLGYKENEDFYIFAYDWRKPVEETVENLNSFLNNLLSQNINKFNLVGHSLGGLISRIYTQKYKDKVNKIISVGSPHKGVAQVYKPLEAGEIDRENTFLWLAQKMILVLNKSSIESDRETIRKRFPVAKDLFPVFDFLKNNSGEIISTNNLSIKNNLLNFYNQNFSDIFDIFTAIYGEKDQNTPSGFIVESPSIIDQLLGNYQDGYPKTTYFDLGDYTVLTNSAKEDEDSQKLVLDHGEIITKKEGIKKILDLLGINYHDENIAEGQKTNIGRSLIFLIKSPAKISVENNGNVYEENDGIIFIPDAQTSNYKLNIQGNDFGSYQAIIGQISENNDVWDFINGEINKDPPDSQIDSYLINYNQENSYSIFPTPTIFPTVTTTILPTISLTQTPTLSPTILPTQTPTQIPILTITTNMSVANSASTQGSNNSSQAISSTITPTPTLVLFSKIEDNYQENLKDNNQEVLGEETEKKEIKQEEKNKLNNNLTFLIVIFLILGIFLYFYLKKIKNG